MMRKKALSPVPSGLGDFWATVHVRFPVPQTDLDDPSAPLQGYYRNFGVRAAPERVPIVLGEAVSDGVIDWGQTEWSPVDADKLDKKIRGRVQPVSGEGVWYQSGRVLYSDPDLESSAS